MPTKTRPGGVHANGTWCASNAYPAKNFAFFLLKPAPARAIDVALATADPHVLRSSASYAWTVPVNATDSSPNRTSPATSGSSFHARALTDPRDVVSQIRPPEYANTSGVQCGPRGVEDATAQNGPCSRTCCTAVDRKLTPCALLALLPAGAPASGPSRAYGC